ncbi:MAG TPA: hypothetical protein VG455_02070, partial [Acidimicrobiales bacterium]|nr:hypothetical protein [Acidimicrobiales bacterium]
MAERDGVAAEGIGDQVHDRLRPLAVAVVADQRAQAVEGDGGGPIGRRGGIVEDVLGPGDEALGVRAGGEQAAVAVVPEELQHGVGGGRGLGHPAGLAGGLGQAGEGVDQGGVVSGVG